jgi:hypothetical protein
MRCHVEFSAAVTAVSWNTTELVVLATGHKHVHFRFVIDADWPSPSARELQASGIPCLCLVCGIYSFPRHWREMGNLKAKDCRIQWMMATTPPLRQPQQSQRNRKRWIAKGRDPGVQVGVGYRFVCYIQHENITTWHQTTRWSTELSEKLTDAHLINNFSPQGIWGLDIILSQMNPVHTAIIFVINFHEMWQM